MALTKIKKKTKKRRQLIASVNAAYQNCYLYHLVSWLRLFDLFLFCFYFAILSFVFWLFLLFTLSLI